MRIGRIVGVVVLSVAVGAGLWLLGLSASFALAFGLLPPVIALLWECRAGDDSEAWGPPETVRTAGARHDITRLAWALRSTHGRVGDSALKRVRALAARRLAALGLQLDEPDDESAIVAAIGARAFQVVSATAGQRADRSDVDVALSRLSMPLTKENS